MNALCQDNFEIGLNSLQKIGNIDIPELIFPNFSSISFLCWIIQISPYAESSFSISKDNI
jgi:hypothetical protein